MAGHPQKCRARVAFRSQRTLRTDLRAACFGEQLDGRLLQSAHRHRPRESHGNPMMMNRHNVRNGFLLLEMVLALAVFGMAATGFVVALHRMSATATMAQSELRITRILDSALDETLSLPVLE